MIPLASYDSHNVQLESLRDFSTMTDLVTAMSSRTVTAESMFAVIKTKRYSIIGRNPTKGTTNERGIAIANNLAAVLQMKKMPPAQTGWQREVGIVPHSAYPEGVYEFKFRSGRTLLIPETFEAIGTRVWDCAPSMARWFEKGDFIRGKNILELGAGTGLLGLACAALGARRVVVTDLQSILKAMERSIESTGMRECCIARALDWNDLSAVDALRNEFGPFDMIVASDVLVFAGDASTSGQSGLIKALLHLAEPQKTEILMGCNKNRHGFLVGFYASPPHHLFDIQVVNKDEVDEEYYTDLLMLYRMYLKPENERVT